MPDTDAALRPLAAKYYRRHAVRIRKLAADTTTFVIREHRRDVVGQYDAWAQRVEEAEHESSAP